MKDFGLFSLDLFTSIACCIIIIAFIWAWTYIVRTDDLEINNRRKWIGQLPSIISTLGVLGTFAGITRGLISFDTNHLDTSIPVLLSGLKTAFFTSLLGMFGSMVLNRVVSYKFDNENKISDSEKAAKLIIYALNNNQSALSTLLKSNKDEIIQAVKDHDLLKAIHQDTEQLKDDIEEIKGHAEELKGISTELTKNVDNLRSITNSIYEEVVHIKNIEGGNSEELPRMRAVLVTATASISTIDNNIEEINKSLSTITEYTSAISQNVEEFLDNSEEDC